MTLFVVTFYHRINSFSKTSVRCSERTRKTVPLKTWYFWYTKNGYKNMWLHRKNNWSWYTILLLQFHHQFTVNLSISEDINPKKKASCPILPKILISFVWFPPIKIDCEKRAFQVSRIKSKRFITGDIENYILFCRYSKFFLFRESYFTDDPHPFFLTF